MSMEANKILEALRPRACSRRRMNIFYLIDTSGSMSANGCMASVNESMPGIIEMLRDVSSGNKDHGEIYVNTITFSDAAQTQYPAPVPASQYRWQTLTAHGMTNLGEAFNLLLKQLHDCTDTGGMLRPAIVLLTDGNPDPGWEEALDRLSDNDLFSQAYKISIALGGDAGNVAMRRALRRFAGTGVGSERPNIVGIDQLDKLRDILRIVSATVSRIGSQTAAPAAPAQDSDYVNNLIHNVLLDSSGDISGVSIPEINSDSDIWAI